MGEAEVLAAGGFLPPALRSTPPPPPSPPGGTVEHRPAPRLRVRALELAVEYARHERGTQRGGDDIVDLARRFEAYLTSG